MTVHEPNRHHLVGPMGEVGDARPEPGRPPADHVIAVQDGEVVAAGDPHAALTEDLVADVFSLDARVTTDPESGTPLVVPRWRH